MKIYENGKAQVNGKLVEYPPEIHGGRNLVLNSDNFITGSTSGMEFNFTEDLFSMVRGKTVTVSAYVQYTNVTSDGRIGVEPSLGFSDGGSIYLGAWLYPSIGSSFSGVISATYDIPDKPINSIGQRGIYIQLAASDVKISRPKLEIGSSVTSWTKAPEDLGLDVPSWVTSFSNASFNQKGIVSTELVEVPTELFSNPNVLSVNDLIDVTKNSNRSITFSRWAWTVLNNAWILSNLKPSTQYTMTYKVKLLTKPILPIHIQEYAQFLLYRPGYANVGMGGMTYEQYASMEVGDVISIKRSFTTVADLTGYIVLIYSARHTDGVTEELATMQFLDIKLEEGNVATSYSLHPNDYDGASNGGTNNSVSVGRNLVRMSNSLNAGSAASGITPSITPDGYLKVVSVNGNGNWHTGWFTSLSGIEDGLSEGDQFTISLSIKSDDTTSKPIIYLKPGMGYYDMVGTVGPNFSTVYYTGVWNDANGVVPHIGWGTAIGTFYIRDWKIEKGSVPTIWTPAPEDLSLTLPAWVSSVGNPISMNQNGISVSDEISEYPNVITNGLKLWYDFKGMGNTSRNKEIAPDLSGNGNDGNITSFTFDTTSGYDDGLMFDSVDDHISVNNPLSYQIPSEQAFTVDAMIKLDSSTTTEQYLISGINRGLALSYYEKPLLYLNAEANDYYVYGNKSLEDSLYHHVAFVFNNKKNLRRIYCDGVDINLGAGPNNTSTPSGMASFINIGQGMLGKICSVRIYDRNLTYEEVKYNYEVEKGRWN